MKTIRCHVERRHGWILLGFYLASVAFSLVTLLPGSISGHGDTMGRSLAAALGAFAGPFCGAIARGFQDCCWRFSLGLFPLCFAFLFCGLVVQFLPLPPFRGQRTLRLIGWCVGWAGWFGGIPLSYLHALD